MKQDAKGTAPVEDAISELIRGWTGDSGSIREMFLALKEDIAQKPGVTLDFKPRPGVSYSLRGTTGKSSSREGAFFVMVDVIDDDPVSEGDPHDNEEYDQKNRVEGHTDRGLPEICGCKFYNIIILKFIQKAKSGIIANLIH